MDFQLPYFDFILSRLECKDPLFEEVFSRHVHFGCWDDEQVRQGIAPTDRLCQQVLALADIKNDQQLLDVGCGIGGTLATLDSQFFPISLTGLNIDERQLKVARERVLTSPRNPLNLVVGNACDMKFADASFDRILATECIFHFPSREDFFRHVARTLRPGGNLTITDFLELKPSPNAVPKDPNDPLWGYQKFITLQGYKDLAAQFGLRLAKIEDITISSRPNYSFIAQLLKPYFPGLDAAAKRNEAYTDAGFMGYFIIRFEHLEATTS